MYNYSFTLPNIFVYFFIYIFILYLHMDFKEYLLTQREFSLSALAFRMWPNNKGADTYLSKKLNGLDGRSFTSKDEILARAALKELGISLVAMSKKK